MKQPIQLLAANKEEIARTDATPLAQKLAELEITLESVESVARGKTKRDEWECYAFDCSLKQGKKEIWSGPYYQGLAHAVDYGQYKGGVVPTRPHVASVMASLLLDSSVYFDGESFEDWCANFGYETDSRKALEMYLTCQEIGGKLQRALGREVIEQLREAAQEF